ncbi:MAG: dienelactone hydrolase family protein [Acidimicrobiales bacterium]
MADDHVEELAGFSHYAFDGPAENRKTVYHRGPDDRPGVILLHELPGMVEECVTLGTELSTAAEGFEAFQVHMPLLFGSPNQNGGPIDSAKALWCMRNEMSLLSASKPSPITRWVAALAEDVATRTGVDRVGVIGMCLTGSLVFGLAADTNVGAVVASQPSLPFAFTPAKRRSLGMPKAAIRDAADSASPMLAMRYRKDIACPRRRLEELADAYGGRFDRPETDIPQDETIGNLRIREIPGRKHALLTLHRDDETVEVVKRFLTESLSSA